MWHSSTQKHRFKVCCCKTLCEIQDSQMQCGQRLKVHFQQTAMLFVHLRTVPSFTTSSSLCFLSSSFDPIQSTFCAFLLLPRVCPFSMPSFVYPCGPSVVLFLIRLLVPRTPLEFPALPIVQDQGTSCCNKLLNNVSKAIGHSFS